MIIPSSAKQRKPRIVVHPSYQDLLIQKSVRQPYQQPYLPVVVYRIIVNILQLKMLTDAQNAFVPALPLPTGENKEAVPN